MNNANTSEQSTRLGDLVPQYLAYARAELGLAEQTVQKYEDCLRQVVRLIGNRPITDYTKQDVMMLKSRLLERGNGPSRRLGIVASFKGVLRFAQSELELAVIDADKITMPKLPRREVVYLTREEVEQYVNAIRITTLRDKPFMAGVRFRALVEMLLGSAMRIGELLALDREQIDSAEREVRIIGKGGKERTVFITERALSWLNHYLDQRRDDHPALFVTLPDGWSRLARADISGIFARNRRRAGIRKQVSPQILRHTAATQLLLNGCPIGHIKEILGHERLETTCRYYLGVDHRAAKSAHEKFLVYNQAPESK